jgi:phosphoesterase RecJ-like protein
VKAATTDSAGRYALTIDADVLSWLPLFASVKSWLVVPHMNPDADTLGSSLALASLIERLGGRSAVVCADPVSKKLAFLPGASQVLVNTLPADWPQDSGVVTLDAAECDRLGCLVPVLKPYAPFVNVDHHVSNTRFGSHNWVDTASAATGEVVYLLYDFFGLKPDKDAATNLYAAIVTDTGFFRYASTTERTLAIASELLKLGINFRGVIEGIYEQVKPSSLRLLGLALANLKMAADGQVAWVSLSRAMFEAAGALEEEAEPIVDQLRELAGVSIFYTLRQSADHSVRVSLRSKGPYDVNSVAQRFGGGGHLQAAGCLLQDTLENAEARLLETVLEHLAKPNA